MYFRSSHRRGSVKKYKFPKIHRKTPVPESLFLYFMKKEAPAQMLSHEFCRIFKNTFFTEHLRATASGICYAERV